MKYSNSWHLLQNDKIMTELSTNMYNGLSTQEAKRRRLHNGANNVWHIKQRSVKEIAVATLFDLATLLLIVSVGAAALFDKSYEAGAIALILVLAGLIRTVTYVRANRIFEDMARNKIPVASVIRDGAIRVVPAAEIVEGDIMFLEAGDTVVCDARVISGEDAIVTEKNITENKSPVHKFNTVIKTGASGGEVPCEFRSNMLYAGSRVLSGSLRAVAVACGKNTLVSMKNGGIEILPAENIPVVERLRKRSKTTSLIMLGCVMIMTWLSLFISSDVTLPEVFLATMAMAVAAMSEFLTAIGYIIVAITLRDASDGKTDGVVSSNIFSDGNADKSSSVSRIIIREPEKLDDLTTPDFAVFCGSRFFKSGKIELSAYRAKGVITDCGTLGQNEKDSHRPLGELLSLASAATAGNYRGLSSEHNTTDMNDTSGMIARACLEYSKKTGQTVSGKYAIIDHLSAGERRAAGLDCSIVKVNQKYRLIVCGAIDTVMRCCTEVETEHGRELITAEMRREIFTETAKLEFSGGRVIAIAKKPVTSTFIEPAVMTVGMTFVGFVALSQETEKEANSNIRTNVDFIKRSGIVPVLFTENPESDLYYCHRFGLFNKKTVVVSVTDIASVDVESLDENGLIISFTDIGGLYLANAYENAVSHLKNRNGEAKKVIAVGMDMWDMGALIKADIGIAVSSSEFRSVPEPLSKNASVIIYPEENRTEPGFGGITGLIRGIKYARRAVDNIDSAKVFITASQTARLLIVLLSVFTSIPLLNAVFILIWGLLFDFITALVMAFENNGKKDGYIRDKFLKKDEEDDRLSMKEHQTLFSMIVGVIWGLIAASAVPLCSLLSSSLGLVYSKEIGALTLSVAVVLSGTVLAFETMKKNSIFSSIHPNTAQLLYVLTSILFSFVILFTESGAKIAGGIVCPQVILIALIPMCLLLLISEISKLIIKNHKKI